MRYVDNNNFARFRLEDNDTTCYEERIGGVWSKPAVIGANGICDEGWHTWRIVVRGADNQLFLDGKPIGHHPSSQALVQSDRPGHRRQRPGHVRQFRRRPRGEGDRSQRKLQLGPEEHTAPAPH